MKRKIVTLGILGIFLFSIFLTGINAKKNEQRLSQAPDPGYSSFLEPAIDSNGDLQAAVYIMDDQLVNRKKLKLTFSLDGGENWESTVNIDPGNSGRDQRKPDVAVTKMWEYNSTEDEYIVKNKIFVVWQEYNNLLDRWEIWVRNFSLYGNNLIESSGGLNQVSYHGAPYTGNAINPRIEMSYLPNYLDNGYQSYSRTVGGIVYEQMYDEGGTNIVLNKYCYDNLSILNYNWLARHFMRDNPSQYQTFKHPSITIDGRILNSGQLNMMPYFYIHVVYDEKCDNQYQCCYQSGEVEGMYYDINYYNPNNDFNEAASKYAYPDVSCRFRYLTSGNCEVVCVWQDSNNDAIAMYGYYPNRQQVNLGPCRDPTMRGISVDMTDVQYYQFPGNSSYHQNIRKSWTNPGGITVIWRSGVINPYTIEYYGIDTQVLEWKNSTFRVCHDYNSTGTDDANPYDDYQQASVTHETNNQNDKYLDISSDSNGESHITREKNGAIWYYTKDNYQFTY